MTQSFKTGDLVKSHIPDIIDDETIISFIYTVTSFNPIDDTITLEERPGAELPASLFELCLTQPKRIIAYGWRQSKSRGGNMLLVCADCHSQGRGYTGDPMTFTGPFDEPATCVFCKREIQS